VLSVGPEQRERPQHPRLRYLTGAPIERATVDQVREITGDTTNALVILGTVGPQHRMVREFEAYRPFVPVGSYVVVEETIVNGHPVWPGFGPGPNEAVQRILVKHGDFAVDPTMEKYAVTFNTGGYLKRIK
jgi:cephalosporin hydroxylase